MFKQLPPFKYCIKMAVIIVKVLYTCEILIYIISTISMKKVTSILYVSVSADISVSGAISVSADKEIHYRYRPINFSISVLGSLPIRNNSRNLKQWRLGAENNFKNVPQYNKNAKNCFNSKRNRAISHQILRYLSIPIPPNSFFLHICEKKYHLLYLWYIGIVIGIGRYEKYYIGILSVSADKKIEFIGLYRYRPI